MDLAAKAAWLVPAALACLAGPARAAEPVLVEFHYTPVPNLQIAIWIEDRDGKHALDVLVTQATGKYGIGNRPGRWDFLSSWRFPYGPRPSVLPIWAHRRGVTYPRIVFHDDDHHNSLGWHELTSSDEPYFCIPLTPEQHQQVSVDTMTCPSPKNFNTDKGRFDPQGGTSPYPPRNDLLTFDPIRDHEDAKQFSALNDLDAFTAATPPGDKAEFTAVMIPADVVARGPLTAHIEVNLEHDENSHYDFDREDDHFVDPLLSSYGVEYLGQPSVLYSVTFDPDKRGFVGVLDYAGYGDWDGKTGAIHPPDGTISESGGSGADRLRIMSKNGSTFRWGVYSHGAGSGGGGGDTTTGGDTTGGDSDSDSGDGTTGDDSGGGWGGSCQFRELAPVADLQAEALAFDRVRLTFTIPEQPDPDFVLYDLEIRHVTGDDITWTPEVFDAAFEVPVDLATLAPPGARSTVEVGSLWGDYNYHFAVVYRDPCTNRSAIATTSVTTPPQKFQTVDSFCFVATAAYGAAWAPQVAALRAFRDTYLKTSPTGIDLVRFYYGHSPALARVIADEPLLRGLARVVLQPVADVARLATAP